MGKIKKNVRGWSVNQKINAGRQHIASLTNNADFPNASTWLPPFQAAHDELSAAHQDAALKRAEYRGAVARVKASEKRWNLEYGFLASRAEIESGGSDPKMVSAGFKLRGARTVAHLPGAPEGFHATMGDRPGRIDLTWDGMTAARSYVVEMCADQGSPENWKQLQLVARSSCTIKDLTSGTKYWFRVAAIGTAGQGPWSQPVQKMAP